MSGNGEPIQTAPTTTAASQRIADLLRERILTGELSPGARIVQDDVAAELETSRLPVREALRILHAAGLVVLRANSGAWVMSMDLHDCQVSYEMRERLEPMLLTESMPELRSDDLDQLDDLQRRIEAVDDIEEFLTLDRAFHWGMYRRNRVSQLGSIVARLWDTTQPYRRAYTHLAGSPRQWVINAEHRLLLDAVHRTDTTSAERVLALHIRRTRIELSRHPDLFEAS